MTDVVKALGRAHGAEILAYLGVHDRARFSHVERDLDLNPATVDRRLKELADAGLVDVDCGVYEITSWGRDALVTIARWDEEWAPGDVAPERDALVSVGSVARAAIVLRDAKGSDLHRFLETLSSEGPPPTDDGMTIDEAEQAAPGEEPAHFSLAVQYGLVAVEDNAVHLTRVGEAVLHLLETIPL